MIIPFRKELKNFQQTARSSENGKIRTVPFTKFHKLNFLITAKATSHTQETILSFQNQQIIPATFTFNINALPMKTVIIQQTKQKLLMLENGTQFLTKN